MTAPPILQASPETIARAAASLRNGQLVAFPTETVYGLGGNARDDRAVAAIFAAKGRPDFNPLIVHVACLEAAEEIAIFDDRARALAASFWPGPLTLVLPRRDSSGLSTLVSAGLPSVAIRIPAHDIAQKLLTAAGIPIAAPSANRSGKLSPTAPMHVVDQFDASTVAMILAGGRTKWGLESTVLDLTEESPMLLRPGSLSIEDLAIPIRSFTGSAIKAPGMMSKHYAPQTKLRLNVTQPHQGEAFLGFGPDSFSGRDAVLRLNLSEDGDLVEAAANLFAMLHELDRQRPIGIAVAPIPQSGLGVAINDRLQRATS